MEELAVLSFGIYEPRVGRLGDGSHDVIKLEPDFEWCPVIRPPKCEDASCFLVNKSGDRGLRLSGLLALRSP